MLARAADTIADTPLLAPQKRLHYLLSFRKQIEGPVSQEALREITSSLVGQQTNPDEKQLLFALPKIFTFLEALPDFDQQNIRSVVTTLTHGMETDLVTFPVAENGPVKALKNVQELDDYIYHVAGCVGEFWTIMSVKYVPGLATWDLETFTKLGIQFGKALQLTNILRDFPKDLRIGRCYLPEPELQQLNLTPEMLTQQKYEPIARMLLYHWLNVALEYYNAAETYTLAIPRRYLRLRLAVLWPVLIGLATLHKLAKNKHWLDQNCSSKVSRGWIYFMISLSIPVSFTNLLTRFWIQHLRQRVLYSLE